MFKLKFSNHESKPGSTKCEASKTSTKLPHLWSEPSLTNLQTMMQSGTNQCGMRVEQPFSVADQDLIYQLNVIIPGNGMPIWTMLKGKLTERTELWSLPTIDIGLVHNLVLGECTDQTSEDLITAAAKEQSVTGSYRLLAPLEANTDKQRKESLSPQTEPPDLTVRAQVSLEGDLEKLALSAVLQSLLMTQMSGRLEISGPEYCAEIQMHNGRPVHAIAGNAIGDNAIIELLAWKTGKFRLFPNVTPTSSSVVKRLETLLIEGAAYQDQYGYLREMGLQLETNLSQARPGISERQFEDIIREGPSNNVVQLKAIYLELREPTSLFNLLRRLPMSKTEWVPLLYALTQVNLVRLSSNCPTSRAAEGSAESLDARLADNSIAAALLSLQRSDTELFGFPIMQYMLRQEVFRYKETGSEASLIVFDLMQKVDNDLQPLPSGAAKLVAEQFKRYLRQIDIIGHFETFDYAIILPHTKAESALSVAQKLSESLQSWQADRFNDTAVSACFGISSLPKDTLSLNELMAAAAEAKKNARTAGQTVMKYSPMG